MNGMPQDMNIPEGKIVEGGGYRESGPQVPEQVTVGPLPESGVESSKERAGEKYSEILSRIPTQATASPAIATEEVELDAKSVYNETDEEARVTKLLSLVETKGAEYAVRGARHLNDYYVLDRMHDELAGRFYEALVTKGVIRDE